MSETGGSEVSDAGWDGECGMETSADDDVGELMESGQDCEDTIDRGVGFSSGGRGGGELTGFNSIDCRRVTHAATQRK